MTLFDKKVNISYLIEIMIMPVSFVLKKRVRDPQMLVTGNINKFKSAIIPAIDES